ncbi:unnamed protein product, partial [marine sediment metagenome]
DPAAVVPLIMLLETERSQVQARITYQGEFPIQTAAQALPFVKKALMTQSIPLNVAEKLAEIEEDPAIGQLIRIHKQPIAVTAIKSLAEIRDTQAIPILETISTEERDTRVRKAAHEALTALEPR